jgi:MFS family permease
MAGGREVWYLFVFTAITGTAWAFNQPARQALLSDVVPRKDLMNAVALTSAGFNTNKVLAPVLGGMLIAVFGPGGNFIVQGLAYTVVLATVLLMRLPSPPSQSQGASLWSNLKEGMAYVAHDRMVLTLMAAALVPQLLAMPYQSLMPVFQKDVLGLGPEALGLLLGAPAVGALVCMLFMASMAGRLHHQGRILLVALVGWGVCLMLFSRADSLAPALAALVGVGACQVMYNATTNTILQLIVPAELRGRVMSIYFLDQGLQPAGALMGGLMAGQMGAPNTVTITGAAVLLLGLLIVWRAPRLREWSQ